MTEVYWNATRKLWSLRENGRVVGHEARLTLHGCTFHVRPGGRDRVRRTGRKEVHAWARGERVGDDVAFPMAGNEIRYNPRHDDGFQLGGSLFSPGAPITEAEYVVFLPDGRVCRGEAHTTREEIAARLDAEFGPVAQRGPRP